MSSKYSFPIDAIFQYEQKYSISFQLSREQIRSGEEDGRIKLANSQLISAAEQIHLGSSIEAFAQDNADKFNPLSVAVFVFNDAVWNLMTKKEESTDTMLPMVSIPGFFWKLSALSKGNPSGSERDTIHDSSCIFVPNQKLTLMGTGADFCGIVEAQVAEQKSTPRPVLAPQLPGPTFPVPKYEAQDVGVNVNLYSVTCEIYTHPQKRMDYTFSEHPKVFLDHGMAIIADGSNVTLRIGGKKPQKLYGDVWVLFGKRWGPETNPLDIIHFHVWLNALYSSIT